MFILEKKFDRHYKHSCLFFLTKSVLKDVFMTESSIYYLICYDLNWIKNLKNPDIPENKFETHLLL